MIIRIAQYFKTLSFTYVYTYSTICYQRSYQFFWQQL